MYRVAGFEGGWSGIDFEVHNCIEYLVHESSLFAQDTDLLQEFTEEILFGTLIVHTFRLIYPRE